MKRKKEKEFMVKSCGTAQILCVLKIIIQQNSTIQSNGFCKHNSPNQMSAIFWFVMLSFLKKTNDIAKINNEKFEHKS